jgi:hypothetical protein
LIVVRNSLHDDIKYAGNFSHIAFFWDQKPLVWVCRFFGAIENRVKKPVFDSLLFISAKVKEGTVVNYRVTWFLKTGFFCFSRK